MTPAAHEIAFIDTSITDRETLLAGLNEGVEVIHLFPHGSSGELTLGGMRLNAGNLVDYGDALVTIGNALSETGDILLYGCNVAQGEAGQEFIAQLAAATGADVAVSGDLGGNATRTPGLTTLTGGAVFAVTQAGQALIRGSSGRALAAATWSG